MTSIRHIRIGLAVVFGLMAAFAWAQAPERIVVSAPGPHNLSYLPIDLIPALGIDRAEGVNLQILHTGGGSVALNNLVARNADFAVAGVPAAMSLRAQGGDVVIIAAVDDAPLFVLMVRTELRKKVKKIADLKGKVIGVNTSTKSSKTTSQQLAELLLAAGGVSPDAVRVVPAGQSWVEQSSLIYSGEADAIVGDEPFASRLLAEGRVFFLAHLAQPDTLRGIRGTQFLHAALETRSDVIAGQPEKAEKMVRMLKKALAWIASHTPEQVADTLGVLAPEERAALVRCLARYPKTFSRDARFSTAQLKETDAFFHSSLVKGDAGLGISVEQIVDDRWAGRKK